MIVAVTFPASTHFYHEGGSEGQGVGGERLLKRTWNFEPREEAGFTKEAVDGKLRREIEMETAQEIDQPPGPTQTMTKNQQPQSLPCL